MTKRTKQIIGMAFVIVMLVLMYFQGREEYNNPVPVLATDLALNYEFDESTAIIEFQDRTLHVSGRLLSVGSAAGSTIWKIQGGSETLPYVSCVMLLTQEAQSLVGEIVKVEGKCVGIIGNAVKLEDGKFISIGTEEDILPSNFDKNN